MPVSINGHIYSTGASTADGSVRGMRPSSVDEGIRTHLIDNFAADLMVEINAMRGIGATSSSSVAIGTGTKIFALDQAVTLPDGQVVEIADRSNPANAMFGKITAASSGSVTVDVTAIMGSGTIAAWRIGAIARSSGLGAFAVAGGTADAMTATPSPAWASYADGAEIRIRALGPNTVTTPTLNVSALGAKTLVKQGGAALAAGDYVADQELTVRYNATADKIEILNPKSSSYSVAGQTAASGAAAITDYLGASVGGNERKLSIADAAKSFGKILQIVTVEKTAQVSYSSTSEGDISGFSLTITPKISTSTILLFAFVDTNMGYDGGGSPELSRWARVKWALNDNSACDAYELAHFGYALKAISAGAGVACGGTVVAEDAPGSTSAQTYKLRAWLNDTSGPSSLYINQSLGGTDGRSVLMAVEIASKS